MSRPCACAAALAVGLLAIGVRLPFHTVGLVPDEGGYAHVAAAWSDGARLYDEAWVDRPQGLMLVYRVLLALGDARVTVRLGSTAAAVLVALLLVLIGWIVHSRAAGLYAGALYAVVGVAPRLEGYTLHGELAASVPATAAVATALWAQRTGRERLLIGAGALGAVALLMKQSAFDGLVVALVIAAATWSGQGAARRAALTAAGAVPPLVASAAHGAIVSGWSDYWHALVGYRMGTGPAASERLEALTGSLDLAARDLLPLALLAVVGGASALCRERQYGVPLAWLVAAFLGFHVGGAYWAHYYMQLVAPLALSAGILIASLPHPAMRWGAAAFAAAPVVPVLVGVVLAEGPRAIPSHRPAEQDEAVARYLRRQTRADERVYVFVSRPNVYFLARRRPPTPYVWHPPLREIPGAMEALERELSGRWRPAFVVVYQTPAKIDASATLGRALIEGYVRDARAPPGLPPILVRR